MTPVRLKPASPRSRVKHFTTEPLRSIVIVVILVVVMIEVAVVVVVVVVVIVVM